MSIVAELGDEGGAGGVVGGSAFIGPVIHIHCHAAVAHQGGHRVYLFSRRIPVKFVRHQVVAVDGVLVVHGEITIGVVVVSVCAEAVGGIFVVVDDLRHGGGHAAGNGLVVTFAGTKFVVIRRLVPRGGEQWGYGAGIAAAHRFATLHQFRPCLAHSFRSRQAVLPHVGNLVGIALQPCGTVGGDVLRVETPSGGIAQHGCHRIVGRHNDEAAAHVIDIEQRVAAVVAFGVGQRAIGAACHRWRFLHHKIKSDNPCLFWLYG